MNRDYPTIIRHLLDKAESTDSEAERDALTAKAEHLMITWGVDAAEAMDPHHTITVNDIVLRRYTVEGPSAALLTRWVALPVAGAVCPSIRTIRYPHAPTRWAAAGLPADLDRVELYTPHIVTQARDAWTAYRRRHHFETNTQRNTARRAFFMVFGRTVAARLSDTLTQATTTGYDLVLANSAQAAEDYLDRMGVRPGRRPRVRTWDDEAATAGRQAGNEASLTAAALH